MNTIIRLVGYTSYASMPNTKVVFAYGRLSDAPTSNDCVAMHIPFAPISSIVYDVCFGIAGNELGYIWVRLGISASFGNWTLIKAS